MATEKRLIDANVLIEHLNRCIEQSKGLFRSLCVAIKCFVEQIPTVDAVEVVRCKDCVCYEETCPGYGYCYHWDYEQGMSPNQVESDDFCSYGERRNDG